MSAEIIPSRFCYPSAENKKDLRLFGRFLINGDPTPNEEQLETFRRNLMLGDAAADHLADWYEEIGIRQARPALEAALLDKQFFDAAPVAIQEFVRHQNTLPAWLDRGKIELGAQTCRRASRMGNWILRDIALMGGYHNSAINKPLTYTGALAGGVQRRLSETRQFWIDVTRPDALFDHGKGLLSASHVRIMHALLRRRICADPNWQANNWGTPINQSDMLMTNLAFSALFVLSMRALGFHVSAKEGEAVMHLWRYVGYLMGIDEKLLPETEQGGRLLLYLGICCQPPADEESKKLAQALRDEPLQKYRQAFIGKTVIKIRAGISRLFLSRRAVTDFQLPTSVLQVWVFFAIALIFLADRMRLIIPGGTAWAAKHGGRIQAEGVAKELQDRQPEFLPKAKGN